MLVGNIQVDFNDQDILAQPVIDASLALTGVDALLFPVDRE